MKPNEDERTRVAALAGMIFAALHEDGGSVPTKELTALTAARDPNAAADISRAIPHLVALGAAEVGDDDELRLTSDARRDPTSFLKKISDAPLSVRPDSMTQALAPDAERASRFPPRDPRTESWLGRNTPLDHASRLMRACPECQRETVQDSWTGILGAWAGFSMPFAKKRTAGKVGTRTTWYTCAECGGLMPGDEKSLQWLLKESGRSLLTHRRT